MSVGVRVLEGIYCKLQNFVDRGMGNSAAADELRDSMDELWFTLNHEEQDEVLESRAGTPQT